jgi:GH25 family lysozyme M1 (1,4-beta-N-acetylmuramidase)
MTARRFAALAQALAIVAILVPGPHPGGPAPVAAAAAGTGIGCTAGVGTFQGPRLPGDPPLPPGAAPAPSPTPAASDGPEESSEAPSTDTAGDVQADDVQADGAQADGAQAGAPAMLLASTSVRLAQADPAEESPPGPSDDPQTGVDPSPEPAPDTAVEPDAAPGAEPTPRPQQGRQVRGIDVSHHNGDIDYEQVLSTGRTFAFIKATQDTSFRDPMYEVNVTRARQAGVHHGAYHFFDYTLDGVAQADHFVDRIESVDGHLGTLPPVVDIECWRPSGVSTHVTAAARLQDFVTRVYERTARLPMVYTSVYMWDQVMGNAEGFEHLPLWAACWGCDAPPRIAPGWQEWHFWQTGVGRIPNVGRLDANVFNGTLEDLEGLRLRPFRIDEDAPAVAGPEVRLDLGGRDGDRMRTSLDGVEWTRWRPIRETPLAQLAPVEGPQTVFVQLRVGPDGPISPVLSDSIALDLSGPVVTDLAARLPLARLADAGDDGLPVAMSWTARDDLSGLGDATLSVTCDEGSTRSTDLAGSVAPGTSWPWSPVAALEAGVGCDLLVVARDGVGNVTRERLAGITAGLLADAPSDEVRHTGEWRAMEDPLALDGRVHVSESSEAAMSATLTGSQAGVIALRGPDGGIAAIHLDGEELGRVDLYAPEASGPEIVFVADLPTDDPHELTVRPLGIGEELSGGAQVALDGFVTLTTG